MRTVNTQLIELYWSIGHGIAVQQEQQGWGSGVIKRLAEDLRTEFPDMKGLSARNLQYMTTFAGAWTRGPIGQHPAAQLPWGHIMVLLDKVPRQETRDWYAASAVEYGWTCNVLLNMIMNKTLERTGEVSERDLEQAPMDRIIDTLRELGPGFAFVGRQVHFDVGGDDFYVGLLFFHMEQLRYIVIELKTGKFQPEHAGQLNFYVALVDDMLRREVHADTVGILICGTRTTTRSATAPAGQSPRWPSPPTPVIPCLRRNGPGCPTPKN